MPQVKTKVVVFGKFGAHVLVNPDPSAYANEAHVAINPDLAAVANLPPHMWALVEGKVVRAEDGVIKQIEDALNGAPVKAAVTEAKAFWSDRRLLLLSIGLQVAQLVGVGTIIFELVRK